MARISVIGGTGYAGGHIVAAATARGHGVTSYSRSIPDHRIEGADYVAADVLDDGMLHAAIREVDVVVSALSPRGPLAGRTRRTLADLADLALEQQVRLGVVGGAGSLRIGSDGPLVKDTERVPAQFTAEADEMGGVLDDLRSSAAALDWFYVSPAAGFGPWAPGVATGVYRLGGDELLTDAVGGSAISGADLADAVVHEIETREHSRRRFSVAY